MGHRLLICLHNRLCDPTDDELYLCIPVLCNGGLVRTFTIHIRVRSSVRLSVLNGRPFTNGIKFNYSNVIKRKCNMSYYYRMPIPAIDVPYPLFVENFWINNLDGYTMVMVVPWWLCFMMHSGIFRIGGHQLIKQTSKQTSSIAFTNLVITAVI